jgi:hypothetical protein
MMLDSSARLLHDSIAIYNSVTSLPIFRLHLPEIHEFPSRRKVVDF